MDLVEASQNFQNELKIPLDLTLNMNLASVYHLDAGDDVINFSVSALMIS